MKDFYLFGLQTADMELAKSWIEQSTQLQAIGRTNDYVEEYYTFGDGQERDLKLVRGTSQDEDGDYPTDHEFPNWSILLYLSGVLKGDAIAQRLESQPEKFKKLRVETI